MWPQFPSVFCDFDTYFLLVTCFFVRSPLAPANIYTQAPRPFPKIWELWAQHPQISCKLLILKGFPMPKTKKSFWAQHTQKRQSIDFKQVFPKILGNVINNIYKHKSAYISTKVRI